MNSYDKGTVSRSLFRFILLLVNGCMFQAAMELRAQEPLRGELCLVWYNVENLYYPDDDSATGDEEFTPRGPRHWTWTRYRDKLTAVAKVIVASGRGEPPELVGLCEVENARVLEDLIAHPILSAYRYSYVHRESPDHRGMDVACLIRMERIRPFHWECLAFAPPVSGTRDLMHLSIPWKGDTLDLFLVHLLSQYRGTGATAALRSIQAGQMARLMDSVYVLRRRGWVVAAGDFNESYQGYSMAPLRAARFGPDSLSPVLPENGGVTYKYRGRWSPIDQVLVLQSFPDSIRVSCLQLPFLLTEDREYGGNKPRRCYEGFQYQGGVSDHLPLMIDFGSQ